MLDTGSSLNCALAQEKWTTECQAAVQQIIDIKNQTKKRLNITPISVTTTKQL